MKLFKIALDAAIIPNQSLGGLHLGSKISQFQDLVVGLGIWQAGSFELVSPFEARYRLGKGELEISVDVRNGKIFKLTACQGYQGKLFGKIAVGMGVAEAMKVEPRLHYDEAEELILCAGFPGVAIDVQEIDPQPALVPKMPIASISVYAKETQTKQGVEGNW
ncbi:MAG: hypothetical protein EBE86_014235 [Hormoscilla sp. GUM202]|nr:hypothetical protein [Hormoscilla sp. GUM202]